MAVFEPTSLLQITLAPETPSIILEYSFLNPSTLYPLSQNILVTAPNSIPDAPVLWSITMPDATYAPEPLNILVSGTNSEADPITIYDFAGNAIGIINSTDTAEIQVVDGGTGNTSFTVGAVLTGDGTNPLIGIPPVQAGYVLTDNGPGFSPSFQEASVPVIDLPLSIEDGGTGGDTALEAVANLLGDLGLSGQVLTSTGPSTLPVFIEGGSGTGNVTGPVSSIQGDIALFNNDFGTLIVDSGVSFPIPIDQGGTGGDTQVEAVFNLLGSLGESGQVLTSTGPSTLPIFQEGGEGSGDVTGPESSVAGDIAIFDNETGTLIEDSGVGFPIPISAGGTGGDTELEAVFNLLGSLGESGQVLTSQGSTSLPIFTEGSSGSGNVTGPISSIQGDIALFNNAEGTLLSDSTVAFPIPITHGGTGASTNLGATESILGPLGSLGQVLTSQGSSAAPVFLPVSSTVPTPLNLSQTSSTATASFDNNGSGPSLSLSPALAVTSGGTGATTPLVALENLLGNLGQSGQVLTSQGSTSLPIFSEGSSGSGNVTGPVSSSVGDIALFNNATGTLLEDSNISFPIPVAHGGTGGNTDLEAVTNLLGSLGSLGQILTSQGSSSLPIFTTGSTGTGNVTGPNSSTVGDIALFDNVSGTLLEDSGISFPVPVSHGGTGTSSFTADGILYGSGTSAIGVTAAGSTGQVLTSQGSGSAPSFQTLPIGVEGPSFSTIGDIALFNNTTGTLLEDSGVSLPLPIAHGGTGETTGVSALSALTGISDITYGVVTGNSSQTFSQVSEVGASIGQVLTHGGPNTQPTWQAAPAPTAPLDLTSQSSVATASFTNSGSGAALLLSPSLAVASGGTGATTSLGAAETILGSFGTIGQVLTSTGASTAPVFSASTTPNPLNLTQSSSAATGSFTNTTTAEGNALYAYGIASGSLTTPASATIQALNQGSGAALYASGLEGAIYATANGTVITATTAGGTGISVSGSSGTGIEVATTTGSSLAAANDSASHATATLTNTGSGFALTLEPALDVTNGGTGATSFTNDGILYGSGTAPLGVTAAGSSGQVLTSNGSGVAPSFKAPAGDILGPSSSTAGDIALFNNTTGSLLSDSGVSLPIPIAHGGTGAINDLQAVTNLLGSLGSSGQVLTSQGSSSLPIFSAGSSGSGNVTGPVSSSTGDIALFNNTTGTLLSDSGVGLPIPILHGGTGSTTALAAFENLLGSSLGSSGQVLTSTGSSTAPIFQTGSAGSGNVTGPSSATVGDIALFNNSEGTLLSDSTVSFPIPVSYGGTGTSTFTADGILYGSGTSAIGVTAAGTTGQVLTSQGSGSPPIFLDSSGGVTIPLDLSQANAAPILTVENTGSGINSGAAMTASNTSSEVPTVTITNAGSGLALALSPSLDITHGGTGATSALSAVTNLLGSLGSSGQILTSRGTSELPFFTEGSTGTGNVTGPVSSVSGDIALFDNDTGTLLSDSGVSIPVTVPYGGTGLTTVSTGYVLTGNGTGNLVPVSPSASGHVLTSTGSSTAPSFQAPVVGVTGPGTSISGDIALFNNSDGTLLSDSGVSFPLTAINGGTGITSYAAGNILYASGTNTLTTLPPGSNSEVLTLVGGLPEWQPGGSTVIAPLDLSQTSSATTLTVENPLVGGVSGGAITATNTSGTPTGQFTNSGTGSAVSASNNNSVPANGGNAIHASNSATGPVSASTSAAIQTTNTGTGTALYARGGSSGSVYVTNGQGGPGITVAATSAVGVAITSTTASSLTASNGSASPTAALTNTGGLAITLSPSLDVPNGGTGNTAFTSNGILYGKSTFGLGVTSAGSSGQYLMSNGSGVAPSFQAVVASVPNPLNLTQASSSPTLTIGSTYAGGTLGGTIEATGSSTWSTSYFENSSSSTGNAIYAQSYGEGEAEASDVATIFALNQGEGCALFASADSTAIVADSDQGNVISVLAGLGTGINILGKVATSTGINITTTTGYGLSASNTSATPTASLSNTGGLALTLTPQLDVTNGGTGATSFTADGILYGNGTSAIGVTAAGTSGQVLTSQGAGVAPIFADGGGSVVAPFTFTYDGSNEDYTTLTVSNTGFDQTQGNKQTAFNCTAGGGAAAFFQNESEYNSTVTITSAGAQPGLSCIGQFGTSAAFYGNTGYSEDNTSEPVVSISQQFNLVGPTPPPALSITMTTQSTEAINCAGGINIDDNGTWYPYNGTSPTYGFLPHSGNTGNTTLGQNAPFSIRGNNRFGASEFDAFSSIKLKNKLLEGSQAEEEAVELFKKIPFVKYNFKDKKAEGDTVIYGMIAEELREVCPNYVTSSTRHIPNIQTHGTIISKERIDDKKFEYIVDFQETLDDLGIVIQGEELKGSCEHKSFKGIILELGDTFIKFSSSEELEQEDKAFIYGTKEDCPSISKQRVFEMGMVVIQNLLKEVEALKGTVKTLKEKLN